MTCPMCGNHNAMLGSTASPTRKKVECIREAAQKLLFELDKDAELDQDIPALLLTIEAIRTELWAERKMGA